ncbi:MAG: DUF4956 domain-containing protein [Candidatus Solibacter sp.]|nr:DUF4956 domain-containing protein [Candidatus Solibacter sp.]
MSDSDESADSTWGPVAGVAVLGVLLVVGASAWPGLMSTTGMAAHLPFKGSDENALPLHPFAELLKLVIAALVGIVVTTVHKRYHRDKPLPRSLMQAQVLLCVAGALMMVIIGSSVARAFGVAGAAGIVRFRTPVEDPKDSTLLFLLVGLGMACGVGLLEVAGLGTAFLCLVLVVLDRFGEAKSRQMILSVVAVGKEFPSEHVNRVLGANVDSYEAREMLQGTEAVVKYSVTFSPTTSLQWLNQQLMAEGTGGLKSVSWAEPSKKS